MDTILNYKSLMWETALKSGVKDCSYHTVRYGMVSSYCGQAVFTMPDGRRWKAIGHGPTGTAETIRREGYVEFIPIPIEEEAL